MMSLKDLKEHHLLHLIFYMIYFYYPAFLDIFSFGKSERGIFLK